MQIRASAFLNSVRFVRERYGADAHERVLKALGAARSPSFHGPLRDSAWKPLAELVDYLETARALLAPEDPGFFRAAGVDAGLETAQSGFRFLLGSDPLAAVRRAAFMWRFFYDSGKLEVVQIEERELVFRLLDLVPPSRAWCERIEGFLEGCLTAVGLQAVEVRERNCRLRGHVCCEMHVRWGASA